MRKFRDAHRLLLASGILRSRDVEEAAPANRRIIERVHPSSYLDRLISNNLTDRERTALGLPPGPALYGRSAREVEGTRLAARAALSDGIAANLAGGKHHAFPDHGEGFCVLNDVAIAVRDLQAEWPDLRVFVADTDAHQGNGTHAIFAGESQ